MRLLSRLSPFVYLAILLLAITFFAEAQARQTDLGAGVVNDGDSALAKDIESLRQAMVSLNRDLFILEEDLLFPSSTQVAVYLAMDIGEYFALDAVELRINDKVVTNYLYTERQVNALYRGGVQRLYLGNIPQGKHQMTAYFVGIGPEQREYKRAVSIALDKSDEPLAIELQVLDSTAKQQPIFTATVL
ncbi:hypothetical protein [Agaribacter marinus]|uniref:AraC family transcriptional regulator n=1 Tax=Agaribacter marinus TaxID=1431249 RepID=A0AA37SYB0_9ALTE|nr:hypothetical protein [Agaribacter marinus]GLR71332.1 hypothetical protein GCM10007852_22400 [Agaribacter marinus]